MDYDGLTRLNRDEIARLWQDLKESVERRVANFNKEPRPELPKAKCFPVELATSVNDAFQVSRKWPVVEAFVRVQREREPQPSKESLLLHIPDDGTCLEIRVDSGVPTSYRLGADNGKPVFIGADDTRLSPEQLVRKIVAPFLSDNE